MKKRDLWVIVGVVMCAAALFLCARLLKLPARSALPAQLSGVTVDMDAEVERAGGDRLWQYMQEDQPSPVASVTEAGLPEAQSYMVLWLGEYYKAFPLTEALTGKVVTVRQTDPAAVNTAVLGLDAFNMQEADCPDGLCLTEGEVTLQNRENRVLQSYIICLPHSLVLQMVSAEELLDMLQQSVVSR